MTQPDTRTNGQTGIGEVLLEVRNLKMYFPVTSGIIFQKKVADVKAVDGISFVIHKGETLGLVGESAVERQPQVVRSFSFTSPPAAT